MTQESRAAESHMAADKDLRAAYEAFTSGVGFLDNEGAWQLFQSMFAYARGHFAEAQKHADNAIEHADPDVSIPAYCIRMLIGLTGGDVERAYRDLLVVRENCEEGLRDPNDERLYGASLLCGLLVEATLGISFPEMPSGVTVFGVIPQGLRIYYGHTLALRELMGIHAEKAEGIAQTFLSLLHGHHVASLEQHSFSQG